jgi:hypothetical protein
MLLYRKLLATAAASLLVAGPSPAKAIPMGTVTHADRAFLGAAEDSGGLCISSFALTLQQDARSSVTLHRAAPDGNVQAELGLGTLIFSAGQASNIAVLADDALIRPASGASTVAPISGL